MNRADAIRVMAIETLLHDDLTPQLREQFEEHFSDCQECFWLRPTLAVSTMTIHTRGANRRVVLARQGEPFLEFVDVSGDVRFSSYMGERCGPTGASEWSLTICKEATKSTSPACHRAA